jgi:3-dehydroquinate synthase
MHPVLRRNYEAFRHVAIPAPALLSALLKDKKNTATMLGLILPVGEEARIERVSVPLDDAFREQCQTFLARLTPE